MRYSKIRKMDISNGEGIRVSIFMQGCAFNCKECFNPETHDFNSGKEFTDHTIKKILALSHHDFISGLSVLGGEPLHPKNIEGTTKLCKIYKETYPNRSIWVWSGYLFDKELKDKEILNYIDVLVDGTFKIDLFSPLLRWKGSSNQRIIDVKKSLKRKKIVLYEGDTVCV